MMEIKAVIFDMFETLVSIDKNADGCDTNRRSYKI